MSDTRNLVLRASPRTGMSAAGLRMSTSSIWLRVLACLAIVVIACGLKNFLAVMASGTVWCPYLCPSLFPNELFFSFPLFESLFEAHRWIPERSQEFVELFFDDRWNLATSLVFSPVYEEMVFRGPMFLSRRWSGRFLWWLIGILLALVFALSHGRTGLALLPLIVLGICGLWLIVATGRFWPAVALHSLHNFFFTSAYVYHSSLVGD